MRVFEIPDDGSSLEEVRAAFWAVNWFLREFDGGARFLTSTLPKAKVDLRNLLQTIPERDRTREDQRILLELEKEFAPLIIPGTPLWKPTTPRIAATRNVPFSGTAPDALQRMAKRMRVSPKVAIAICLTFHAQMRQMGNQRGFRMYVIRDEIYNALSFLG